MAWERLSLQSVCAVLRRQAPARPTVASSGSGRRVIPRVGKLRHSLFKNRKPQSAWIVLVVARRVPVSTGRESKQEQAWRGLSADLPFDPSPTGLTAHIFFVLFPLSPFWGCPQLLKASHGQGRMPCGGICMEPQGLTGVGGCGDLTPRVQGGPCATSPGDPLTTWV